METHPCARWLFAAVTLTTPAFIAGTLPALAQERSEAVLFDESFDVRACGALTVDFGDMDMDVREVSGSSAHVRVVATAHDVDWAREIFSDLRFEAGTSPGGLEIRTDEVSVDWRDWRRHRPVRFRAEIQIPSHFNLDLTTGDGDIRIGSFEGTLIARTHDGDIAIDAVKGSEIRLRTGDGDVTALALDAGDIRVHTGDGDVRLDRVAGPIDAESGDGDVRLVVERFEGLSVRTGDGDVSLKIDPALGADLDLRGEDLHMSRAFRASGQVGQRRITGPMNGGGPQLSVRTADGSISIRAR